jgi:glycosyltransferase involved in cell wall biosynthesis
VEVPFAAPISIIRNRGEEETLRLGTVRSLRRLIRNGDIHIVLAHGGEALKYASLARSGRQLVYRRIGSVHPRTTFGVRRKLLGTLMRRAARVVVLADAVRQETVETFGVARDRIVTIPNGVDPRRLDPSRPLAETRRMLGIPSDAQVVLCLGAFTWEKDPLAQIEVAARVAANFERPAVFVLAGDGPLRRRVAEAVGRHGLDQHVRLLGHRADAADLLAASNILLGTSQTEGMPAAVIEAGMVGLPVIAFDVGGMAEAVSDGTTGLLVPPGRVDALASRLLTLLRNEEARRRMGLAARARCRARFDIRVVAPRYLRLIRELTAAARTTTHKEVRC